MTYEEALKEAKANVEQFPQGVDEQGRVFVVIENKKFPKDWFIRTCARLRTVGEIKSY